MMDYDMILTLLEKAYETDDEEETERLLRQILEIDEYNPEALILLSDLTDDPEERLFCLERAWEMLEEEMQDSTIPDDVDFLEDNFGILYVTGLLRLAFAYFSEGRNDEALELAQILVEYDPNRTTPSATLFYRLLLENKEYGRIIEESLKKPEPFPAMLHSLAIATFKLSGPGDRAYKALWSAISSDPAASFYMLGYLEEPDDDADPEMIESFNLAMLFEDAWLSQTDTSLSNWLASAIILLGLAASVFPLDTVENMMILADALDIADSVEDVIIKLEARSDWGVLTGEERLVAALELISSGRYLPDRS